MFHNGANNKWGVLSSAALTLYSEAQKRLINYGGSRENRLQYSIVGVKICSGPEVEREMLTRYVYVESKIYILVSESTVYDQGGTQEDKGDNGF